MQSVQLIRSCTLKDLTLPLMLYNFIFELSLVKEVERETRIDANVEENTWDRAACQSLLPNLYIELTLTHACLFFETRPLIAQGDLKLTQ